MEGNTETQPKDDSAPETSTEETTEETSQSLEQSTSEEGNEPEENTDADDKPASIEKKETKLRGSAFFIGQKFVEEVDLTKSNVGKVYVSRGVPGEFQLSDLHFPVELNKGDLLTFMKADAEISSSDEETSSYGEARVIGGWIGKITVAHGEKVDGKWFYTNVTGALIKQVVAANVLEEGNDVLAGLKGK